MAGRASSGGRSSAPRSPPVTSPPIPFGDVLDACRRVTGSDAEFVWVPSERLLALGLDPWMGVPLWIAAPGWEGANRVSNVRALREGLSFRPLHRTIADTWAWDRERRARGEGLDESLTAEREQALLRLAQNT